MRECYTCKKPYEDFGVRRPICRKCKKVYDRNYHANRSVESKQRKQELQKIRRAKIKQWVHDYRVKHGCTDCGQTDFRVLEFDHLPGHDKEFNISDAMATGYGKEKILTEIKKCDVVCSNCHRIRTYQRITEHSSAW
jgi:hypothetical protein